MKIMHLLIDGAMGGAEIFYLRLSEALRERGIPQHMVLTPSPYHEDRLRQADIPFDTVRFDGLHRLTAKRNLRAAAERAQPDAIVAWMNRAGRHIPQGDHLTVGRIGGLYGLENYRSCELIVANSPVLLDHARESGRPDAVMIPNFVKLSPTEKPLPAPRHRPVVLAVGRLNPKKNMDILVRAIARTEGELWIAGVGGEKDALLALAAELGISDRVTLLGWRDDMRSLLKACDIFALCSDREGTSNAILEAAVMSKPILVSSGYSVSWFLEGGVSAEIVPVRDVEATAEAISRIADDPAYAASLGRAAHDVYQSRFSEDAICAQWIETLSAAIEAKRAKRSAAAQ
jgi:glycosyltransferase involved in cell wall biosynthesis